MSNRTELDRLRSLRSYHVLDTAEEAAFDRLTHLAAELFDSPIALVSLIDEHRQWFKSRVGLDAHETPRDIAFCAHAIEQQPGSLFVVEDAAHDPRFQSNPLVTSNPNVRFYAGAVLTGSDGYNLGTLCIIDDKPRPALTEKEERRLRTLAQVVVDELELQRARREVDEKNILLDLAERMSGLGRWRYDVADGKITWSDEVFRIHGLPVGAAEPDVETALARYFEQDRDRLRSLFQNALATGQSYQSESRIRRDDGAIRHVTSKAECFLDEAGKVETVVGVFQDVTEQVEAARFLETIADNVPCKIAYWDSDLKCRFANQSYQDWFGLGHDQILGMALTDFMGEAMFAQNQPFIQAALAGERQTFERTLTSLAGDRAHMLAEYIPDVAETGGVRGIFVLITDVTDLKRSQLQLKHTNRLLSEARDQAEAASAAKGEFLSYLSQKIQTPLTLIVDDISQLKGRADLNDAARTQIARTASTSQVLLSIVNDLVDYSKAEDAKPATQAEPAEDDLVAHQQRVG